MIGAGAGIRGGGKKKILQWTIAGVALGGAVVLFFIVRKQLENLQIIDDAEERKLKRWIRKIESDKRYSSNYWRTLSKERRDKTKLAAKKIQAAAEKINKAINGFWQISENEEAVIGAMRQ